METKQVEILVKFNVDVSNNSKLFDDSTLLSIMFEEYLHGMLDEDSSEVEPYTINDIEIVASQHDANSKQEYKWETCYMQEFNGIVMEKFVAKFTQEQAKNLCIIDANENITGTGMLTLATKKHGKKEKQFSASGEKEPIYLSIKNLETNEEINYI